MDVLTKKQRSYCMSHIRDKNTGPEISLKRALRKNRLFGFRTHCRIAGKPDIYFPKKKIAIFIDGCFWHKCPLCYRNPKTNIKFWGDKIDKNRMRDIKINRQLKKGGVHVIRFWEHNIETSLNRCLKKIKTIYERSR